MPHELPQYAVLAPAYGRDYKNKAAVITDFKAGKDFEYCPSGQYCSIRDCAVGTKIQLRYKKLAQVTVYTVTEEDKA